MLALTLSLKTFAGDSSLSVPCGTTSLNWLQELHRGVGYKNLCARAGSLTRGAHPGRSRTACARCRSRRVRDASRVRAREPVRVGRSSSALWTRAPSGRNVDCRFQKSALGVCSGSLGVVSGAVSLENVSLRLDHESLFVGRGSFSRGGASFPVARASRFGRREPRILGRVSLATDEASFRVASASKLGGKASSSSTASRC